MTGQALRKATIALLARKGAYWTAGTQASLVVIYRRQPLVLHLRGPEQPSARQAQELTQAGKAGGIVAAIQTVDQLQQILDRIDQQQEAA